MTPEEETAAASAAFHTALTTLGVQTLEEALVLWDSVAPTGVAALQLGGQTIHSFFGIPPETAMLVLIRPISGSAALAVGAELMAQYGVDSQIGRTAAVMLGSTETTFYTISVYFGAAGIKKTRYTLPAALFADFIGFLMASWTVKWFF